MIKLRNEGLVQPAPVLRDSAQLVSTQIQSWPRVVAFTHWLLGDPNVVEGAEFHITDEGESDGGELGHIHHNGDMHLLLTEALRNLLVRLSLAKPLIWDKKWVVWNITTTEDAEHALWLFGLGYERLLGTHVDELVVSIQSRLLRLQRTTD